MKNIEDRKVNLSDFVSISKTPGNVRIPDDVLDKFLQCSKLRKKIYLTPDERSEIKDFDVLLSNCLLPDFDIEYRLNDVMEFGEVIPRSWESLIIRMNLSQFYSILTERILNVIENSSPNATHCFAFEENVSFLRNALTIIQPEHKDLVEFFAKRSDEEGLCEEDPESSVDIQIQRKYLNYNDNLARIAAPEMLLLVLRD